MQSAPSRSVASEALGACACAAWCASGDHRDHARVRRARYRAAGAACAARASGDAGRRRRDDLVAAGHVCDGQSPRLAELWLCKPGVVDHAASPLKSGTASCSTPKITERSSRASPCSSAANQPRIASSEGLIGLAATLVLAAEFVDENNLRRLRNVSSRPLRLVLTRRRAVALGLAGRDALPGAVPLDPGRAAAGRIDPDARQLPVPRAGTGVLSCDAFRIFDHACFNHTGWRTP